jgi:uncharacterized protein (DUF697 family)
MQQIRERILELTGQGHLTVEQMRYLIDRMAEGPEMSVPEAETLLEAFLAETAACRTPDLLYKARSAAAELLAKAKGVSMEDIKRKLDEEYLGIERNESYSRDEKVTRVLNVTAGGCAVVAIQPIPFADFFILTPMQGLMATRIASIHGVPVSQEGARGLLKTALGTLGLGFAAQQTALGLYKLGLPGLGGFVTIPLVWGLTYGIGRVMDTYYRAMAEGRTPSDEEILEAFRNGGDEGRGQSEQEA